MWQRRLTERDRRLRALDSFLADYEAEHGEITEGEVAAAALAAKRRVIRT